MKGDEEVEEFFREWVRKSKDEIMHIGSTQNILGKLKS